MSGAEAIAVLGCVAAVVQAFHGGTELVKLIRKRKQRKRERKAKELEATVQEKLLQESLAKSAKQVHEASLVRRQDFGYAFEVGDATAVSRLQKIVIDLQAEVIKALRVALAHECAIHDLTRLHETSILKRTDAISTMDELCQRITEASRVPRQLPSHDIGNASDLEPKLFALHTLRRLDSVEPSDILRPAAPALPAAAALPDQPDSSSNIQHVSPLPTISRRKGDILLSRVTSKASLAPSFTWLASQICKNDYERPKLATFQNHDRSEELDRKLRDSSDWAEDVLIRSLSTQEDPDSTSVVEVTDKHLASVNSTLMRTDECVTTVHGSSPESIREPAFATAPSPTSVTQKSTA